MEFIPAEAIGGEADGPYEHAISAELEERIDQILAKLKPREAFIFRKRFGFDDGIECTLKEIGSELGISKQRIEKIERGVLTKLKTYIENHPKYSKLFTEE